MAGCIWLSLLKRSGSGSFRSFHRFLPAAIWYGRSVYRQNNRFTGDHGHLYVLLAAAVDNVARDIIDGLHVRLPQIEQNQICLLSCRNAVGFRQAHDSGTVGRCHLQDFVSRHCSCISKGKLGKTGYKEHFAEHIKAVIASRAVRADTDRNAEL